MPKNTVKIRHLLGSQLASYIKDEFPLIDEFFSQYYNGLDFQGGTLDLINNIDSYLKLSENANTVSESKLAADITDTQNFIDLFNADGLPLKLISSCTDIFKFSLFVSLINSLSNSFNFISIVFS